MLVIKNQQLSLLNSKFYLLRKKPTIMVGFLCYFYRYNSNECLKLKSDELEIAMSNPPASAKNS